MKSVYYKLALFSVIIALLGLIRFNRNDFAVSYFTARDNPDEILTASDAVRYIALTEYYRSNICSSVLIPPYTTRVLIPFVASYLPFAANTSINIINVIMTIAGLYILHRIMVFYELSNKLMTWGFFIYVFSFPILYYMSITYVDASFIFFIYLSLLFILKENFWLFLGAFILGCMVKEAMIVIVPVYFVYSLNSESKYLHIIGRTLLLLLVFSVVFLILRYIRPDNLSFFPQPDSEIFLRNVSRPSTILSFILTFGVSGIVSVYFLIRMLLHEKMKTIFSKYAVFFCGMIMGLTVWLYSVFSAYSDGRFIWITIPFTIPLMLLLRKEYLEEKKTDNLSD